MRKNNLLFNLSSIVLILLSIFLLVGIFSPGNSKIEFKDPQLEQAVRDNIAKTEGPIERRDVDLIQTLDATGYGIESLEGIEALGELRELILEDNFVKSVSPLAQLTKLRTLNLRNNEIISLEEIDFEDILYLPIDDLSLRHNVVRDEDGNDTRLSDVTLVGKIMGLEHLDLRDNDIKDLTPISNLRDLQELDIRENKFDNISALETLVQLENLNIRDNKVESLEPLRYLTRLTKLNIHSVEGIDSLDPLSGLVNLEALIMRNVEITDNGQFLRKLTKLQRLNVIDSDAESIDQEIIDHLLARGALQGDVRPERLLHTIETPILSQESGFYNESFEVVMDKASADDKIYYTLDGSEPTLDSEVYEQPITIDKKEEDGFTVLRAKTFAEGNKRSETITKSYFVSDDVESRFAMPVFSLVTDPYNLFNPETGIHYEENTFERGSDWERPVHVEFFETDGTLQIAQNAGIRIHGGLSRGAEQKSLRIYASAQYDDKVTFNYPFFEGLTKRNSDEPVDEFKRLILRNGGNDRTQTMFNDGLTQEIISEVGTLDTQSYRPSVIFINGEYYGIQNIRERMDEYYLASHYDVDTNDITILENDSLLYRGSNSDVFHYSNMLKYIEDNGVEAPEHYEYISTLMDMENFIDYFATEIFFANADWPANNIQYWRKATDQYEPNAPYGHDGRWRWMILDMDFAFFRSPQLWGYQEEPLNHYHNTIQWVLSELDGARGTRTWPNFLFRELLENETFKQQFITRFSDLSNSYYAEIVMRDKVDEVSSIVGTEINHQIARWEHLENREMWEGYVANKYTFANERPPIIREYIREAFNLIGTIPVTVPNETEMGYIRVNTLAIQNSLPGNTGEDTWTGIYYAGVPMTFEAIPKEGYKFSHWENNSTASSILSITPDRPLTVRPIFTRIQE